MKNVRKSIVVLDLPDLVFFWDWNNPEAEIVYLMTRGNRIRLMRRTSANSEECTTEFYVDTVGIVSWLREKLLKAFPDYGEIIG